MKTDAERVLADTCRHDAMNKLALIFTSFLMDNGFFRSCSNCEHWVNGKEICGKYDARPPVKVIVAGCEDHSDFVPF